MRIDELTFEVRDSNLNRVGQLLPSDLVGSQFVMRFNNVGTWNVTLRADAPLAEAISTPGAGIVVTHVTAGVILSGPTISAEFVKDTSNLAGVVKINGVDDSAILGERIAYPTWTTDDVTQQTVAHDSAVNVKASTAMYQFVKHNCIAGITPASRAVPGLTTAADTLLGSTITKRARFDILGELLSEIAVVDGLGFEIVQKDLTLEFRVFQPIDRTGTIRMDVANNTLASTSYGYAKPALTAAIVAGQGDLEERQLIEVETPESQAAEALWKRRIEMFIDQRNTDVVDELTQAGLEELAASGSTLMSVDVVPASDSTMRFGSDWNLGDKVTVVVDEQEVSSVVTEVALSVNNDGVHLVATVGEPTGVDYDALVAKTQAKTVSRVNALERVEASPAAAPTGGGVSVSEAEPVAPVDSSAWFSSTDGSLYVRYNDGDSTQWVEVGTTTNGYDDRLSIVESVTSQPVSAARMPSGSVIGFHKIRTDAITSYSFSAATIITELNVPYTPKFADSLLVVQWMITYEANYNSTFRIARDNTVVTASGYEGFNSIYGTNAYSGFAAVEYDSDVASTPNTGHLQYFALANSTSPTVFQVMLTHSSGSTETFRLNRAFNSIGNQYEVGVSTATIMEIAQ